MKLEVLHAVAESVSDAGFLKVLFPLLSVVGPLFFFYFGHMGVTKRRTLRLHRPRGANVGQHGGWAEGSEAVWLGWSYFVTGTLCAVIMLPIVLAMLGIL